MPETVVNPIVVPGLGSSRRGPDPGSGLPRPLVMTPADASCCGPTVGSWRDPLPAITASSKVTGSSRLRLQVPCLSGRPLLRVAETGISGRRAPLREESPPPPPPPPAPPAIKFDLEEDKFAFRVGLLITRIVKEIVDSETVPTTYAQHTLKVRC